MDGSALAENNKKEDEQMGLEAAEDNSALESVGVAAASETDDKAEVDRLSKRIGQLDALITAMESLAEDGDARALLETKKTERDRLRTALRGLKPIHVQIRNAVGHRMKVEKRQARLITEETDLRVLLRAKQIELAQATADLTSAISQVDELEAKHRAEGLENLRKAANQGLSDPASGLCFVPPEQLATFQAWCVQQATHQAQITAAAGIMQRAAEEAARVQAAAATVATGATDGAGAAATGSAEMLFQHAGSTANPPGQEEVPSSFAPGRRSASASSKRAAPYQAVSPSPARSVTGGGNSLEEYPLLESQVATDAAAVAAAAAAQVVTAMQVSVVVESDEEMAADRLL